MGVRAALHGCVAELDAALEVWKDITFNYESTDTPDLVVTPTPAYSSIAAARPWSA